MVLGDQLSVFYGGGGGVPPVCGGSSLGVCEKTGGGLKVGFFCV